jgi:NTE family protein
VTAVAASKPNNKRNSGGAKKLVNLALQGGGAHGAFTWGVLDKLLEDGRLAFEGLSGTSAGAVNAVVMIDGWTRNGREGARHALSAFWAEVARTARLSPLRRSPFDGFFRAWGMRETPAFLFFDILTRLFSPYELNPFDLNPLRDLVGRMVDFRRVKECTEIGLFVAATNVHTGRVRIFKKHEISLDVIMASTALPTLYRAVTIDGVPYWDGGYMGNPPLWPFFYSCEGEDVVIVQINPIERRRTPRTAAEIEDRVNEITFNASLLSELRAIDFVGRLLREGRLERGRYKDVRIHMIADVNAMPKLGLASKFDADWDFLVSLRDLGRSAAERFLTEHLDNIGKRSSVDVRALFADRPSHPTRGEGKGAVRAA